MMRYLPLIFLLLLAMLLGLGLRNDPGEIPSPLIGKDAPDFELPALAEQMPVVSKQSLLGEPYLLNVWATWCANCKYEHPILMQIASQNNIAMIGLNYKDDRSAALQWLQQYGNPYKSVAFDASGDTSIDFGVYGAPETFLVDAHGKIVHKVIGPISSEIWTETLSPLVKSVMGQ